MQRSTINVSHVTMATKTSLLLVVVVTHLVLSYPSTGACPTACDCSDGHVNCYSKNLPDIPLNLPKDAVHIDLNSNDIPSINDEFHDMTSVKDIQLRYNKISHIAPGAFSNLPQLTQVNLQSNLLDVLRPGTFQNLSRLSILDLSQNQLMKVDGVFDDLSSLTKLVLTDNKLEMLTVKLLQPLTSLVYFMVDNNQISVIEDQAFYTLKQLAFARLNRNPLHSIDGRLSKNDQMVHLELTHCQLKNVPTGLPWQTRYLNLSHNIITNISQNAFLPTRFLGVIDLSANNITSIASGAFKVCPHVQTLWLNDNGITEFPTPLPASVTTMYADNNQIETISNPDFQENSKMLLLSLKGNKLKDIGPFTFANLKSLDQIFLSNNQIGELKDRSFSGIRNLTVLDLSGNPITIIEPRCAAGLLNLNTLDLSRVDSQQPSVQGSFFRDLPLLKTLRLRSSPGLVKIFFNATEFLQSFSNFKELDLRDNKLQQVETDLPRFLPRLEAIYLGNNTWLCDTRLLWLHDWIARRPEIFKDMKEVTCDSPKHLAGALIRDLPFEALHYTTTTTTNATQTPNPTVKDDWFTEGAISSGDEEPTISIQTITRPTMTSSQSITSKSSERENNAASVTESYTKELIDEITTEGFITTEDFTAVARDTTVKNSIDKANITVVTFSTVLPQDTTKVTKTDIPFKTSETSKPRSTQKHLSSSTKEITGTSPIMERVTALLPTKAQSETNSSMTVSNSSTTLHASDAKTTTQVLSTTLLTAGNSTTNGNIRVTSTINSMTSTFYSSLTTTYDDLSTRGWSDYSPLEDSTGIRFSRTGSSPNRMPSIAESSARSQSITITTSVTIMVLIMVMIAAAMILRHRKKIKRAYFKAFHHTVEASDTALVLNDQDDSDMLPESQPSTLGSRSSNRSRSFSDHGQFNQSSETFVFDEL